MKWWILFVALCAQMSVPAYGQEPEQARAKALYANGKMLFDEGRFNEAIKAWQEAHNLTKRPLLLYNIALAHEALGQFSEAIEVLFQYRIYAPKEEQPSLLEKIEEWEAKAKKIAESRAAEERAAADKKANQEREEALLKQEPTPVPSVVRAPKRPRGAAAVLWGSTAVLAGGGVAFALLSNKHGKAADEHCDATEGVKVCTEDAAQAFNRQRNFAILADTSWGLSIVGGGFALWFTLGKSKVSGRQKSAAMVVEPTRIGIQGRF